MTRAVALAAALALSGCAALGLVPDDCPHPTLSPAVALVWDAYGMKDQPPQIRIAEGAQLTCTDPVSGSPGFPVILTTGPGCRNGFTISPLWSAISLQPNQPWHSTSLAHELMHQAQWRRGGIVDPGHLRPEWSTEVPAANALLLARGL